MYKYCVLFTNKGQKYAVEINAKTKEAAILAAVQSVINDSRSFDTVEVAEFLIP